MLLKNEKKVVALLAVVLNLIYGGDVAAASVPSCVGDTLVHSLHDVTVRGWRVYSYVDKKDGADVVDMKLMEFMPQILGNADPIHYAQLLPGVQTNSEYDAGLHIQGCESSHNIVAIDGVPIYNVAHMLGFFSVFNATHFSNMTMRKSLVSPITPNRLGGMVDMHSSDSLVRKVGGDVSIGPMSSQGTLRLPLGRRMSLTVSAREAYLNLLYGRWLKMDGAQMRYSFGDYNISLLSRPNERNMLRFVAYFGHDNVKLDNVDNVYDTSLRWGNFMATVHWKHLLNSGSLLQTAYFTGYRNRFNLDLTRLNVGVVSDIYDLGYKALLSMGGLKAGAELARHSIQPQEPHIDGGQNGNEETVNRQTSVEASLFASWRVGLSERLALESGVRTSFYTCGRSHYFSADPGVTFNWHLPPLTTLSVKAGIKHQYLFQTGFSNVGMPTEFWLSAGGTHRPQYSYDASVSMETFSKNKMWRISCDLYYKRLFHQMEYTGNVFDFVYFSYSLEKSLLSGNGYNYGLNLMVEKRKGRITGWMSYAFGRALRRYPGMGVSNYYHAAHERPHELNAVATCKLGSRWNIGATFVAASGNPYTKVERFYLISDHIVADYGDYNAERLPMYMRLDLSVNYDFKLKNGRRSGFNFSLYNVTAHENVLLYRLVITRDRRTMAYNPLSFVAPLLPSISYYYSF